ncbi:MAG: cytochrome ubiquinol oxidase subunit I, partial [Calditrichaeota bacterium]|nr:cytochrome ubiquinol oxidase subunit I [Calditrichota bacterium]
VFAVLLPQIANQVGWFTAEMGRQPWVVYGLLRTSDALSASVTANQVLFSLIMFFLIYALLFALFLYLLDKKIKHGPFDESEIEDRPLTKGITTILTGK